MVLNNHFNLCLENKTHYVYLFFILLAYGRFKVGKFFSAHPVSQHLPLNHHLNKIGVKQSAACPLCDYPSETVEHFLFFCRKLTDLRGCFLPTVPHTSNCLYSSFKQLEKKLAPTIE